MRTLRAAIARWRRDDLQRALDDAGVPAGPLNSLDQVLADPHVAARQVVGAFDDPVIGPFPALGLPYKFDGWDDPAIGRPPQLGEHTDDVLIERLGLTRERIAELRRTRVI
jgi:crotonobetainyl-CoA:carnitine CoA-transferase CaiB-like acyl-CoA transferase